MVFAAGVEACKKEPFGCMNTTGLSPDEVQARTNVLYADLSTDKSKTCEKCHQFVAGKGCGTCKLLKGPIHPEGTCKAFTVKS